MHKEFRQKGTEGGYAVGSKATYEVEKKIKGGDPAAPSSTATLLRLHPSH